MDRKIKWPEGHDFAFTVIDDTDGATVANVKPVYDCLFEHNMRTTKTCWVYPPRDAKYKGQSISDSDYLEFLLDLKNKGFEIAFHNAGSGGFKRDETLAALKEYREKIGDYPKLHINHGENIENIYWGKDRFKAPVSWIYSLMGGNERYFGDKRESEYFWGDFCKEHIKFIRNRTFLDTDTLKADKRLVYRETGKEEYSNYWFSSSDGMRLKAFLKLLTKEKVDRLAKNGGCAIVYTHFAYDFVDGNGKIDSEFEKTIDYISSKNGWFVPASELLEYVLQDNDFEPSKSYERKMDIKWLLQRILKMGD